MSKVRGATDIDVDITLRIYLDAVIYFLHCSTSCDSTRNGLSKLLFIMLSFPPTKLSEVVRRRRCNHKWMFAMLNTLNESKIQCSLMRSILDSRRATNRTGGSKCLHVNWTYTTPRKRTLKQRPATKESEAVRSWDGMRMFKRGLWVECESTIKFIPDWKTCFLHSSYWAWCYSDYKMKFWDSLNPLRNATLGEFLSQDDHPFIPNWRAQPRFAAAS